MLRALVVLIYFLIALVSLVHCRIMVTMLGRLRWTTKSLSNVTSVFAVYCFKCSVVLGISQGNQPPEKFVVCRATIISRPVLSAKFERQTNL